MAFFKLICVRNNLAKERTSTSVSAEDARITLHTHASIKQISNESNREHHPPSVARCVSLVSSKKRFSLKNIFRRMDLSKVASSDSEMSMGMMPASYTSLQTHHPLSGDVLFKSKSTTFPQRLETIKTELKALSTQSNLTGGAFCTDISQSESTISHEFKHDRDKDTSAYSQNSIPLKERNSKECDCQKEKSKDSSESQHQSPAQTRIDTLTSPVDIYSKQSNVDEKTDSSFSEKDRRSGTETEKKEKENESQKETWSLTNHVEIVMNPTINATSQTEHKVVHTVSETNTNSDTKTSIYRSRQMTQRKHHSVYTFTESIESADNDLPACRCMKKANSSSAEKRTAFINYKREYFHFLANQVHSKTCDDRNIKGTFFNTSAKGENHPQLIKKSRNASTNTSTGCPLCDANLPSHTMEAENHAVCSRGDVFNRKYIVLEERGRGTFGKVFQCLDVSAPHKMVAVKVVRATKKYSNSARIEASILRYIQKKDRFDTQPLVRLLSAFIHVDHVCLVFPLMGPSLYAYMKTSKMPFMLGDIKSFAYQILKAVKFLHKIGLAHTDLKPENVLLVNPQIRAWANRKGDVEDTRICVIDLGSATFRFEKQPILISTRHYRAPEVVLQLGWSYPCDIWSVGCILMELYCGSVFFRTHDNQEHLQMMERAVGRFPTAMVKNTKMPYFVKGCVKDTGKHRVSNFLSIDSHMKNSDPDTSRFRHLIRQLMALDPNKRVSAEAACKLSFFRTVRTDYSPSPTSESHSQRSPTQSPTTRSRLTNCSLLSCNEPSATTMVTHKASCRSDPMPNQVLCDSPETASGLKFLVSPKLDMEIREEAIKDELEIKTENDREKSKSSL